ncbi:hypothetical protein KI387_041514, partial [Taxus chinensis]
CWEIHYGLKGVGSEEEVETEVKAAASRVDTGKWVETRGGGIEREAKTPISHG